MKISLFGPCRHPRLATLAVMFLLLVICASSPPEGFGAAPPSAASPAAPSLTLNTLRNLSYKDVATEPVKLHDGVFEGQPFIAGGTARLRVELLNSRLIAGDLNGDGKEEAVAFLRTTSGGSAVNIYMAVVAPTPTGYANTYTLLLGDRVGVRWAAIEKEKIFVVVLQTGRRDTVDHPGDLMPRSWILERKGLVEQPWRKRIERLSLASLAEGEWVYKVNNGGEVTLRFDGDKVSGFSGCNRYLGTVESTKVPGELTISVTKATKRSCPTGQLGAEDRYLDELREVTGYWFAVGDLILQRKDDKALRFTPRPR